MPGGEGSAVIRTFLIADVRGYTRYTQFRGDEAAGRLAARFADAANEVVSAAGGRVQELRGDEAMCVFGSPRQAIRAAADLQRRFVALTIDDPDTPLGVGIGIDAGEVVRVKGGYRGGALNRSARLCSMAHAGQILASAEAVHLAGSVQGIRYVNAGSVALKGIDDPVGVIRVEDPGAGSDDPAFLAAVTSSSTATRADRARRRRRAIAMSVAAAVVVAADLGVVVDRIGQLHALPAIGTNAVGVVDLGQSVLFNRVPVGNGVGALAAAGGRVWTVNTTDGTVSAIETAHSAVANTVTVGADPTGIALTPGAAWVTTPSARTLLRISQASDSVVDRIPMGNAPTAVAAGLGRVWVADSVDGTVSVVDPKSDKVLATVAVSAEPSAIAVGAAVWVADAAAATVSRIDPANNSTVATIPVGNDPSAITLADGAVWVANALDGTVSRIDPAANVVTATVRLGGLPVALATSGKRIWVADGLGDRVVRIDAARARVNGHVPVGNAPQGEVVAAGRLWVSARGSGASHRGGTFRVLAQQEFSIGSIDPVSAVAAIDIALETDIFDGLVAFSRVGGPGGTLIVPDLARTLPAVSDGGRTYTFELRTGVEFANGQPVRASDVLSSFRRMLPIAENGFASYFDTIIGAPQCSQLRKCASLSRGIEADDATGTVRFHLTQPDPQFLDNLTLPVASVVGPGAPAHDTGLSGGVVGTGPYEVDAHPPAGHLRLVRNPHFHVFSPQARPNGYPDVIDVTTIAPDRPNPSPNATVSGAFDYVATFLKPDQIVAILRTNSTQLHRYPRPDSRFVSLNTRTAPFNDVRVRRAVNLAIDRRAAVTGYGGEVVASPTCQIIPPTVLGYRPYCPYTSHPDAAGSWSGPALATARQLVAASGTGGARVVIPINLQQHGGASTAFIHALRTLGYRVSTRTVGSASPDGLVHYYDFIQDPKNHVQASAQSWLASYPEPSEFIVQFLSCKAITGLPNVNTSFFCDPRIDAQAKAALALEVTDPAAAASAWANIDREITDLAPWVPLANDQGWDLVSPRVGNYQHHPVYGPLIDQMWVR